MVDFELHILGCGSASPTTRHLATSQIIRWGDKLYMIDCGEGTQVQMRHERVGFGRLNHIFLSHLHGDHCFGLPGLISTFGMLGRTADLFIHGPEGIEDYLQPILTRFCKGLSFRVQFHVVDAYRHGLVMEDRSLKVYAIPLKHRIPTCGYLFEEKEKEAHLIREMVDFWQIPVKLRQGIKSGNDYVTPSGQVIPHAQLTRPPSPPRRYAYCSDTAFYPDGVVPLIRGVNLLYHEATFAQADIARAIETGHSTALQAAEIARLAEVGKLVIGHFSSRYKTEDMLKQEANRVFAATILADEGLVIPV
ncbi:MAG: ribonuclease Z [Tannerellaceae bacterium]|jgi:ribonuclease Z|nr:ribonuclease Z [Tannerellaceae bacterium]